MLNPHFLLQKSPAHYSVTPLLYLIFTVCFCLVLARLHCLRPYSPAFSLWFCLSSLPFTFRLASSVPNPRLDYIYPIESPGLYFRPSDHCCRPLPGLCSQFLPCLNYLFAGVWTWTVLDFNKPLLNYFLLSAIDSFIVRLDNVTYVNEYVNEIVESHVGMCAYVPCIFIFLAHLPKVRK